MAGIDKLTHDDLFYTAEEAQEWDEWERRSIETYIRKTAQDVGFKEGMERGMEQGIEYNAIVTIKNMVKKNMPLQEISDITGKSIEEIKGIIEQQ